VSVKQSFWHIRRSAPGSDGRRDREHAENAHGQVHYTTLPVYNLKIDIIS